MILLLHIFIAISSLLWATYLYIRPSQARFYVAYGSVGLTLLSGTYLVISSHTDLLHACTSGLIYLGIVFVAMVLARQKLATTHSNQ